MSDVKVAISLAEAEAFVKHEAALLDDWKTTEWSDLFEVGGEYLVPSTDDPDGMPAQSLHLIHDDYTRLVQRGVRLLKRTAHAEYPHSRTTRIVSNVRVSEGENGASRIDCNFVVYRSRRDRLDIYPGRSIYQMVAADGGWKIRKKIAILGLEELRPQGKLSIIL